jgi:MFS family permease
VTSTRFVSASDLDNPARRRAFLVRIGVGALTTLDLSGVNVALPSIQSSLHADSTELQLIVAGYTLAFGLALVPVDRLGDNNSGAPSSSSGSADSSSRAPSARSRPTRSGSRPRV